MCIYLHTYMCMHGCMDIMGAYSARAPSIQYLSRWDGCGYPEGAISPKLRMRGVVKGCVIFQCRTDRRAAKNSV